MISFCLTFDFVQRWEKTNHWIQLHRNYTKWYIRCWVYSNPITSQPPHSTTGVLLGDPQCLTISIPVDLVDLQVSCTPDRFSDSVFGDTGKSIIVLGPDCFDSQNTAEGHVKDFEPVPPSVQFLSAFLPVERGLGVSRGFTHKTDYMFLCHGQVLHLLGDLGLNYKIQWEIVDKFHGSEKG